MTSAISESVARSIQRRAASKRDRRAAARTDACKTPRSLLAASLPGAPEVTEVPALRDRGLHLEALVLALDEQRSWHEDQMGPTCCAAYLSITGLARLQRVSRTGNRWRMLS